MTKKTHTWDAIPKKTGTSWSIIIPSHIIKTHKIPTNKPYTIKIKQIE